MIVGVVIVIVNMFIVDAVVLVLSLLPRCHWYSTDITGLASVLLLFGH